MLGEFTGKEELNGSLDFTRGQGSSLVISDELGGFQSDSFEDIVDERVHDVHGLLGDTGIGVDLLQDFVDIKGEGFGSSSGFTTSSGGGIGVLGGLGLFSSSFLGSHCDGLDCK